MRLSCEAAIALQGAVNPVFTQASARHGRLQTPARRRGGTICENVVLGRHDLTARRRSIFFRTIAAAGAPGSGAGASSPFATSTDCRHRLRNLPPGNQAIPSGVRRGLVDWLIA